MNERMWGIIGGVALLLALLSPLVLGNSKKVERLFEEAEVLYHRSKYKDAIGNYEAALKESNKIGIKTEHIDKDFTTLVNLKIALCYYELAEKTQDVNYYHDALAHITKVWSNAYVAKHQEELTYLWAEILYKIEDFEQAKVKFVWLIEKFPNSHWVAEALYTMGNINYQQENYEKAKSIFQKLVDKFPHSEFKMDAEQYIAKFSNQDDPTPSNPDPQCEAMYKTASDLKQQGKVHDAYQRYTDIITQFPECEYVPEAYVGKAEIHLEAEDYVNARANYEEAMRTTNDQGRRRELYEAYHRTWLIPEPPNPLPDPEPNDELFRKARLLRMEGQFLEAAEIYEGFEDSNITTDDAIYALYWIGRCYHKAALQSPDSTSSVTSFRKSVDAFERLILDYEDNSYTIKTYHYLTLAYSDWAEVLVDQSKCQLVIDTVEKGHKKYMDNNDPSIQGWLSRMQDLKTKASEKLSLPPPPPDLREEAKRAIEDAKDAIEDAKQKENRKSQVIQEVEEHLIQAEQKMLNTDYDSALSRAKQALEILNTKSSEPEPPLPRIKDRYVKEGHKHFQRNELQEATGKLKQALDLDRNCPQARELLSKIKETHYGRGWTFFDEGQYERAISEFKNAINIDQDFKEAHCHLGVIYIEQEKYTEAIRALKKATSIDQSFKEAHFNLGLAYLNLGRFEEATNAANAALRTDPNYEPARMLIEFIAD